MSTVLIQKFEAFFCFYSCIIIVCPDRNDQLYLEKWIHSINEGSNLFIFLPFSFNLKFISWCYFYSYFTFVSSFNLYESLTKQLPFINAQIKCSSFLHSPNENSLWALSGHSEIEFPLQRPYSFIY